MTHYDDFLSSSLNTLIGSKSESTPIGFTPALNLLKQAVEERMPIFGVHIRTELSTEGKAGRKTTQGYLISPSNGNPVLIVNDTKKGMAKAFHSVDGRLTSISTSRPLEPRRVQKLLRNDIFDEQGNLNHTFYPAMRNAKIHHAARVVDAGRVEGMIKVIKAKSQELHSKFGLPKDIDEKALPRHQDDLSGLISRLNNLENRLRYITQYGKRNNLNIPTPFYMPPTTYDRHKGIVEKLDFNSTKFIHFERQTVDDSAKIKLSGISCSITIREDSFILTLKDNNGDPLLTARSKDISYDSGQFKNKTKFISCGTGGLNPESFDFDGEWENDGASIIDAMLQQVSIRWFPSKLGQSLPRDTWEYLAEQENEMKRTINSKRLIYYIKDSNTLPNSIVNLAVGKVLSELIADKGYQPSPLRVKNTYETENGLSP